MTIMTIMVGILAAAGRYGGRVVAESLHLAPQRELTGPTQAFKTSKPTLSDIPPPIRLHPLIHTKHPAKLGTKHSNR